MSEPSVVQVTLWNSPYLGNFMSSQLSLARTVRMRLGLGTHFVLAHGAEGQPWLADLDAAGVTWSILPARRRARRAHLDAVMREHSAALVHTNFTVADLAASSAAAALGVPCVWHIRTGFNGYPPAQPAKDLLKMRIVARRRVARVIAVSPWLADFTASRGVPRGRIEMVPNAIVVQRFADLPDRGAARERFGLEAGADVVLCMGWWPDVKGVDVLVDALAMIADRQPAMSLLLVGEEQMQSFLAERLPTRPPWLRTSSFVSDSAWLFAAADIFVSASRHEGQSSAIGEALACGLPVVMSDIPGTAGWGGAPHMLTFPSEDRGTLAARLEQLLEIPVEARAVTGTENRNWVGEHFAIDVWCEQICAIYVDLI
jgi:glycosyltransferase involved in cell wall biosynthesis